MLTRDDRVRRPFFTFLPCVRALRSTDCGPAALATVAKYHGLHVSLSQLVTILGTDLQGTELTSLRRGAEKLGFLAAAGVAKEGSLDQIPLPAIAHLTEAPRGHFVTLYRVEPGSITIGDPKHGILSTPRADFMARWSGSVLLLTPSPEFRRNARPAGPLSTIIGLALSHRKLLVPSLVCALVTIVLSLGMSLFLQLVIDRVLPRANWGLLPSLGVGVLFVIAFHSLFSLIRHYLLSRVGYEIGVRSGSAYVHQILYVPLRFLDGQCIGDLVSRLNDVDAISRSITVTLLSVVVDLFLVLGATSVMFAFDAHLAGVVLAFIPASVALSFLFQRPMLTLQRRIREQTGIVYNQLCDYLAAIRSIKVFTAEDHVSRRFREIYAALSESCFRLNWIGNCLGVATTALNSVACVVVIWVGTGAFRRGEITLGQLLFFYSLLAFVLAPVDRLAGAWAMLQEALVGMERLSAVTLVEPEDADAARRASVTEVQGDIEFRDVSFGYRAEATALVNISFHVPKGGTVVIVGETGSGKTSAANLLLGLYEPREGSILIDGRDIRSLKKSSLRTHISMVFQDATLMGGTIRDNITLGAPDASLEAIQEAARLARAHDFILQLPKQYQYEVGERGQALSSGQRQRIAIARALLRPAEILVLDEATSNLDVLTERSVMESIRAQRRALTTIIITHRLANIRATDRVVVLADGRVAQTGSHSELIEQAGPYSELWSSNRGTGTLPLGQHARGEDDGGAGDERVARAADRA